LFGDYVAHVKKKTIKFRSLGEVSGGEGGIRTPDGVAPMPHFECGAFDHSATSPRKEASRNNASATRTPFRNLS
jgi:hypothetical protein